VAQATPTIQALSNQFTTIVDKVSPAVVSIDAIQVIPGYHFPVPLDPYSPFSDEGDFFSPERRVPSVGSGLIVRSDGYIVTNHHVINGVQEIRVTLADNRVAPAKVVGSDSASDLAVLKIDLEKLPTLSWGSSESLRSGEFVLAFGSPFRMRGSVSHGIVSGKGRKDLGIADFENFIQTDAAINPGNSGGPLCNLQGQVVGVNTAILSKSGGSQGIGLAIPSEVARSIFEEIVKKGRVDRAWLGMWVEPVSPYVARELGMRQPQGVIVQGGYRNGPAGKAGFRAYDVILEVDGTPVTDDRHFRSLLTAKPIGKTIEFLVLRQGKNINMKLVPESRPTDSMGRPARGL
jgi:S1-C subfamily serine protease